MIESISGLLNTVLAVALGIIGWIILNYLIKT